MNVAGIGNTETAQASAAAVAPEMGKAQFLQILVAQLGNQDPLNPLDDKEFISQLAQFSGLEQMMETNKRLEMMQLGQVGAANAQAASLLGKKVTVQSDALRVTPEDPAPELGFTLSGDAAQVTLQIQNAAGQTVRTLELGALAAGYRNVPWNGLDENGQPLTPGTYRLRVNAQGEGGAINATTELRGEVSGVSFDNGYPELLLGDVRVRPADVRKIEESL